MQDATAQMALLQFMQLLGQNEAREEKVYDLTDIRVQPYTAAPDQSTPEAAADRKTHQDYPASARFDPGREVGQRRYMSLPLLDRRGRNRGQKAT